MSYESMNTDADIIRLTLSGNRYIFEVLLKRYARLAYAVAYARLGNHEDVQDAVQEAWIQAFQTLHSLRQPEKFRSWFSAIVRNVSINTAKKRWRQQAQDTSKEPDMYDVRDTIEEADMQRALWSHIITLTPDHREVLTLHYYAGMTTEEIAGMIGESRETVKKRLQRARADLNEQMMVSLFEPAERDDERMRKRVMALILFMPVAWDTSASAAVLPKPEVPQEGLKILLGRRIWWAIIAGFILLMAAFSIYMVYGEVSRAAIPPPPVQRVETRPAPRREVAPTPPENSKAPPARPTKGNVKGKGGF